jgi:chemotaxis family two-component system response regulator PixG
MDELPLVLAVDDEPFVGRVLRLLLADAGLARVRVAGSAEEMWAALGEERPALILLDVLLPDAHGLALLGQIREARQFRDIPVVVMTGVAGIARDTPGLDLAQGVMAKPISPRSLLPCVERFVKAGGKAAEEAGQQVLASDGQ